MTGNSRFSGKTILVAGGTGGLGRAVSLAFLEEGATVVVTYRREEELGELKEAAGAKHASLHGHRVDVTEEGDVTRLVATIVERHGGLDALVNAVGGYAGGSKLWETDAKGLEHMLSLNLRSGYVLCRAAVPAMIERGRGAIVNVASRAAYSHSAGEAAYSASKAAAVAMMDALAAELKGTAIRVNSILPSIIDTRPNREAMPKADFSKWPKPEEIARVILFLCTDDARVIHGAAIPVYGSA
jgi:NAD(P)-dependent dehydrogenase (short-subunit alcohol dehydrogenase family)